MEILSFIMLFLTLTICLNTLLKFPFDKLTIYNGVEFHWLPTWFIIIFILFGFLMFPFYKKVREWRKVLYMENTIRQYEWMIISFEKYGFRTDVKDDTYYRYINYKRYLKLKKLKRKL